MDLSTMSDEDLAKLHDHLAGPDPAAGPDLSTMSDDDLQTLHDKMASEQHNFLPFLKNTASGIAAGVGNAAAGVGHAIAHPGDTASDVANWLVLGGGPAGQDTLVGERALRSAPVVGPAYENIRTLNDPDYSAKQAADDKAHAEAHPVLDKAQKLAGNASGMVAGPVVGSALYVVDTYHRSRLAGNDPETALKDARNVGLLMGGAAAAGKAATAGKDLLSEGGIGDAAKGLAEEKAFKAAVGNQSKAYNQAADGGVINARGRELLDQGTVGFGNSAQQIADKAGVQKQIAWDKMKGVLGKTDAENLTTQTPEQVLTGEATSGVSGTDIAKKIRSEADNISGAGNATTVQQLHDAADHYEQMGENVPLEQAQVEKNSWQYKPGADFKVNNIVKRSIGDAMETGVNKAGLGEEYATAKSQYGTNVAAEKDAQVNANRYAKNNAFSLGDKAAAAGAAVLSPHGTAAKVAAGVVAGLANKLVRKRGSSALAVGLDKIGDIINSNPEVFGKFTPVLQQAAQRGPQSLAVTHFMLSQQDPEYQNLTISGD